jgi:hypothetical protein
MEREDSALRGTELAHWFGVRPVQRKVTVRGVGSSFPEEADDFDVDNAFNDDVLAGGSVSGTRPRVSCPPPSGATPASSRYTFIAPRPRQTLSMLAVPVPVPADDAPVSRRRQTLRTDEVQEDVRDSAS